MHVTTAAIRQSQVDLALHEVQRGVGPDAVRIPYKIGEDWSGQSPIFFRVIFTDDAAKRRLRHVATEVVSGLARNLDYLPLGGASLSQLQKPIGTSGVAGTGMGLAQELLEDAQHLAAR